MTLNKVKVPKEELDITETSYVNKIATLVLSELVGGHSEEGVVEDYLLTNFKRTLMTVGGGLYAVTSKDLTLRTHIGDLKLVRGSVFTPFNGCIQVHYGIVNGDSLKNRVLINTIVEMTEMKYYSAVDLRKPQ